MSALTIPQEKHVRSIVAEMIGQALNGADGRLRASPCGSNTTSEDGERVLAPGERWTREHCSIDPEDRGAVRVECLRLAAAYDHDRYQVARTFAEFVAEGFIGTPSLRLAALQLALAEGLDGDPLQTRDWQWVLAEAWQICRFAVDGGVDA